MSHADGHFSAWKDTGLSKCVPRFVTGHDFSRAAAAFNMGSALAAAELQLAGNASPQGPRPSFLFCRPCGTTEVVPCYKTTRLLSKRSSEKDAIIETLH